MTIDNSDIEASKQVVTRAVEKYNLDRLALFAHDGKTPIDPPATFAAKQAKLLESVEWAVERAVVNCPDCLRRIPPDYDRHTTDRP